MLSEMHRVAVAAAAFLLVSCGGGGSVADPDPDPDPGPVHVHGLGINPRDGALFIATHTGLWRVAADADTATRVNDRYQDTMGFTVVGPDHFLGSGHPDARDGLPPHLGLVESRDAGRTWKPVSLLGRADLHILRARGRRVYAFDVTSGRLLLSRDGGRSWIARAPPAPLVDLVVDPVDARRLVAATTRGMFIGRNGTTWEPIGARIGLLGWAAADALYLVTASGEVLRSRDSGRRWSRAGDVGAEPAAFLAHARTELYVALHDGTIKSSRDGGATWSIRSSA